MTKPRKDKLEKEDNFFSEIAAATGGDVLSQLDNCKFFIDLGNLAANYVCSGKFLKGGVPGQRITEFFGPSSSGKSLLAANVLFGCQKINGWAIILDCENATNPEWMEKASHVDTNKIIRYTPFTLEQTFLKIHSSIRNIREYEKKKKIDPRPIVIVYDSISSSPCEREFRENDLPDDYKPSDWKRIVGAKEQPGERAKVCSRELRRLISILEEKDVTLVVINQIRHKIGVMYGDPETTPGGKALEFYASCRVRTQQKKKIEHKKLKTYCGINMQVRNIKNRAFRPFCSQEGIKLYFDAGINPLTGLLTALIEAERITGKGGNYIVAKEYAGNPEKEYKFKSSLERNDVPVQVLLDNPKLIDGESAEEITTYLAPFQAAMNYTDSGLFEEKKVMFDFDGSTIDSDSDEEQEDEESGEDEE